MDKSWDFFSLVLNSQNQTFHVNHTTLFAINVSRASTHHIFKYDFWIPIKKTLKCDQHSLEDKTTLSLYEVNLNQKELFQAKVSLPPAHIYYPYHWAWHCPKFDFVAIFIIIGILIYFFKMKLRRLLLNQAECYRKYFNSIKEDWK